MLQKRLLSAIATLAVLMSVVSVRVSAQGVTTGAISGTVVNEQRQPLESVQVLVVNKVTGARSATITRGDGRYFVQGLEVGGPYTITVRRIGFTPRDSSNIYVSLGQNARVDLSLAPRVTELASVQVTGTSNGVISSSHKGVATTISDSAIARLPTLNRNFTDFLVLSPQISTKGPGNSGGGQNNRFNAIQIDGSVANDLFGLGSTGQPGGQADAKQVSLEAVKEYQILLSPFDLRQGNFTGALINAVTKSGSNELHGSATYSTRNEKLERNVAYLRRAPFTRNQEGFWLGGPIVKNKLLFSVAPEWQQQSSAASGPYVGQPYTPLPQVTGAGVDSLRTILMSKYGFSDPGNGAQVKNLNPLRNIFARLDAINLPHDSRVVARYNYVDAHSDIFSRSTTGRFSLSNNGYNFHSTTQSYLTQVFTNFKNGGNNEFLAGLTKIRDARVLPIVAPFVVISRTTNPNGGTAGMQAGSENSSQGNSLDQDIYEITDNYTAVFGNNRVTIGSKNEFYTVRNLFAQNSFGNFTFGTLDSLQNNTPSSATLGLKLDNSDGNARFAARTLGGYLQDEWQPSERFSTTFGLRVDVPALLARPGSNQNVAYALKINTTDVPRNVAQWSPRIGFNWDMTGDAVNQLRGGTGVFVGAPAFVWLSNLYGNSGVNAYGNLTCSGMAAAPAMQSAGGTLPGNCKNATGTPAVTVNTVDPHLKFPSVWRSSLGFDRRLPGNWIATLEGMYTRSVASFYYQNLGIVANPIGFDSHGRALYGDITSATSNVSPTRRPIPGTQQVLGDVIHLSNSAKHDYAWSWTTQLQKKFTGRFEGSMAYTHGRSYNVWDLTSSVAFSNWSFGRSYSGRQDAQELYPSKWDVPHRVVASGTYSFPTKTDFSFTFFGESGVPFEYVYNNDMNGDNGTANDLVYVPTDAHNLAEIQFSQNGNLTPAMQADSLEAFIKAHDCLNSQRGQIMKRNSCRSPWTKTANISLRQSLPSLSGHDVSVQVDVFNFFNLLNKNWGAQDLGSTNSPSLLTRRSYVAASGQPLKIASGAQPVFNFTPFSQFNTQNVSSNYVMQMQFKFKF